MKTYILILYFQKRIELLSSAMEVITMNDHILNMLKADLTVLDKLGIKPNFADLARKYKMDYRTIKNTMKAIKASLKTETAEANWIPMLLLLKKSFLSAEFLTREYTECFFPSTEKRKSEAIPISCATVNRTSFLLAMLLLY